MLKKKTERCFITVAELAERLRIGRDAAYGLCRREGFPAIRIGGLIRVDAAALEDWLDSRISKSTDSEIGSTSVQIKVAPPT